MPIGVNILIAFLLVLLNGFFVAAEFALVKVRSTRIAQLAEEGKSTARMAMHAIKHLDSYLSATQLGITLSSIGLGWIGEPAFARLLEPLFAQLALPEQYVHGVSFVVAFSLISAMHIVIGELAPKSWAIQRPESLSLSVSYPLHWFYWVFKPAILALNGAAGLLLRAFGIRPATEHELAHTHEELRMIIAASGRVGTLSPSEVDLVQRVFEFSTKNAADVMIPRVDTIYLDTTKSLEENVKIATSHPYSRYPLCDGSADNMIGLVHIKDLMLAKLRGETDIGKITRAITMVPESNPLDQMLRQFQRTRVHLAAVADEHGGIAGIVTLEDVLEELVGEIADEYDIVARDVYRTGANSWLVLGKLHITDVNKHIGSDFSSESSDTLGGFVFELFGKQPGQGDSITYDNWTFTVADTDGRRIKRVRVTKQGE